MLAPAGRLASGYRRYGDAELMRLRFIRRAKALGLGAASAWVLRDRLLHNGRALSATADSSETFKA